MGSESIAQMHEAEGPMGYWLRGHEGGRNNILVKSNYLVKNIRIKNF